MTVIKVNVQKVEPMKTIAEKLDKAHEWLGHLKATPHQRRWALIFICKYYNTTPQDIDDGYAPTEFYLYGMKPYTDEEYAELISDENSID